jgi:hypothetical protein
MKVFCGFFSNTTGNQETNWKGKCSRFRYIGLFKKDSDIFRDSKNNYSVAYPQKNYSVAYPFGWGRGVPLRCGLQGFLYRPNGPNRRGSVPVYRSDRKPVETGQIRISNQNAQFKRFPPVYRPVPDRLTKKRISGEFDVFSNLNWKLKK